MKQYYRNRSTLFPGEKQDRSFTVASKKCPVSEGNNPNALGIGEWIGNYPFLDIYYRDC
jgi:hypothetical protein